MMGIALFLKILQLFPHRYKMLKLKNVIILLSLKLAKTQVDMADQPKEHTVLDYDHVQNMLNTSRWTTKTLPFITKRPDWDFIGNYFPKLGNIFTYYDNLAILDFNRGKSSEINSFTPYLSVLFDPRMFPTCIAIAILIFSFLSFSNKKYKRKAKSWIPPFFTVLFLKYVISAVIILLGYLFSQNNDGFYYFLTFSNIWFGNTASHFYVAVFELIFATFCYLYYRFVLKWQVDVDSVELNNDRCVSMYLKFQYLFSEYYNIIILVVTFAPFIITTVLSYFLPFLAGFGSVTNSISFVLLNFIQFLYLAISLYIYPLVNLVVTGVHFHILLDITNPLISLIVWISNNSYINNKTGHTFSYIGTFANSILFRNLLIQISRGYLMNIYRNKIRIWLTSASNYVFWLFRFRSNKYLKSTRVNDKKPIQSINEFGKPADVFNTFDFGNDFELSVRSKNV